MLSGETAVGQYPVESVAAMDRIVRETELHLHYNSWELLVPGEHVLQQIAQGACALAQLVNASAIVVPTLSGQTAQLVSRHRPRALIVAPCSEPVRRQLALYWGILTVPLEPLRSPGEDRLQAAVHAAFAHGAVDVGALVVVLAGHPFEGGEHVPTLRVVRIGPGGRSSSP
jgi:pyruvate kinase